MEIHTDLRRVRRHFGYRTAGEVLDYLDHAATVGLEGVSEQDLLDDAVFAQVLPRGFAERPPAFAVLSVRVPAPAVAS